MQCKLSVPEFRMVGSRFRVCCLVLSGEWGNGLWGLLWGIIYSRDPFPHSLLRTRQFRLHRSLFEDRFHFAGSEPSLKTYATCLS